MSYYEYKRRAIKFENSLKNAGIVLVSVINTKIKRLDAGKKWRRNNKERQAYNKATWKNNNRAVENANAARYRASKSKTVAYMSPDMKRKIAEVYQIAQEASVTTGYDWHVDHIVPLSKGGLHTLNNLQVVPATWNLEKNNKNCDRYWD